MQHIFSLSYSMHTAGETPTAIAALAKLDSAVQVHQNPNSDSAGTLHGPSECSNVHWFELDHLRAKSQVYEPTRPSTEPEFSPLLLLQNHQMLVTDRAHITYRPRP